VGAINASGTTFASGQSITTTSTDNAWSGYVIDPGSSVNEAFGTWVQPAMSGSGSSDTAIWVGVDGGNSFNGEPGSSTVEQIGTDWNPTDGYTAWIEFAHDASALSSSAAQGPYYYSTNINSLVGTNYFNIQPGDTISAGLRYVSSTATTSSFMFWFQDTQVGGQTVTWSQVLSTSWVLPARATAEWIVESSNSAGQPLASFAPVNFTGAWANVGGTTGPIDSFNYRAYDLVPGPNGGGTDYTSPLVDTTTPGYWEWSGASSSFNVQFVSSNTSGSSSGGGSGGPKTNGAQFGATAADLAPVSAVVNLPIGSPLVTSGAGSGDTVRFYEYDAATSTGSSSNGTPPSAATSPATTQATGTKALADSVSDAYWANPDNTEWLALYAFEAEPQPWLQNQPAPM
jgi:hypothetical protein